MTRVLLPGLWLIASLAAPLTAAPFTNAPAATPPARPSIAETEYQRLIEADDQALEEIDDWIKKEQERPAQEGTLPGVTLKARVLERVRPVREAYDRFLRSHPDHAKAQLAYASFLMEIGDEPESVEHMEKARQLEPSNPAAWNNLANHYGHRGPVKKAFEYYARALELNPKEPTYYQNLATTVFVFRKDAREYYDITEAQVFDKALGLYRQALRLDPTNFVLASELAQSYYGIKPAATNTPAARADAQRKLYDDAVDAWQCALKLAGDGIQREGVNVHIARNYSLAGRHAEARAQLESVTNTIYAGIKARLLHNLDTKEAAGTTLVPEAELAPDFPSAPRPVLPDK